MEFKRAIIRKSRRKKIIFIIALLIIIPLSAQFDEKCSQIIVNKGTTPIFDFNINARSITDGKIMINGKEFSYDIKSSEIYKAYKISSKLLRRFIPGGINQHFLLKANETTNISKTATLRAGKKPIAPISR